MWDGDALEMLASAETAERFLCPLGQHIAVLGAGLTAVQVACRVAAMCPLVSVSLITHKVECWSPHDPIP